MFSQNFWRDKVRQKKRRVEVRTGSPVVVADLFCGCGGLTLGAEMASEALGRPLRIDIAVDSWAPAIEVYKSNFGKMSSNLVCGDVRDCIEISLNPVDVVLAGPPCQGHSDLNNSTRRSDVRNGLYVLPVNFAINNYSKILIVENVPSVVHSSDGIVARSERALKKAGYAYTQFVLNASNLGVPQKRKRHLLIASRVHSDNDLAKIASDILSLKASPKLIDYIGDIADNLYMSDSAKKARISSVNMGRIDYLFDNDIYDLPDAFRPPCHRDKPHSYRSMYGRMRPDAPSQTITSGFGSMGQGRFVHPTRRRMISTQEAARIQGFPDYYNFPDGCSLTALREMIANAVPPAVSAVLLSKLLS